MYRNFKIIIKLFSILMYIMPKHREHRVESSSSSDSECERRHKYREDKKRREKKEKKDKKECIEEYSNEKEYKTESCSESSSSSSSCSEHDKKYNMCDIYDYFKNRLVKDDQLMVAGSSAFLNAVNNVSELIPNTHAVSYNEILQNYNIDSIKYNSPFFVRESGVYIIFVITMSDTSCQLSVFVNGEIKPLTCVGTNSGAGQIVSRHMIDLNKDDHVVVRNYFSSSHAIASDASAGGLALGNNVTYLMMKIAPLHPAVKCEMKELCRKKSKLYKSLHEKLCMDKELMVKGFNITGTFSTVNSQVVNVESPVLFDSYNNVNGLVWNPSGSDPSQVQVTEDGHYKLFFLCTTNTPGQIALAVNGVPVINTIQGTSKGAGQLTIRTLLDLKAGDLVTVINHTSAVGALSLSQNAGGSQHTISAILTVFKIGNLTPPCLKPVDCKLAKHFECDYEEFRNYLLHKDEFQLTGSPALFSLVSSALQAVDYNNTFYWPTNALVRNAWHQQGLDNIVIEKTGLYDLFADICTEEPLQYALFVNNMVDPSTIFGRDSGANRCLMRQFVKLNKGDVIQIRNLANTSVNTVINAGGEYIGQNSLFMVFLLNSGCDHKSYCKSKKGK